MAAERILPESTVAAQVADLAAAARAAVAAELCLGGRAVDWAAAAREAARAAATADSRGKWCKPFGCWRLVQQQSK